MERSAPVPVQPAGQPVGEGAEAGPKHAALEVSKAQEDVGSMSPRSRAHADTKLLNAIHEELQAQRGHLSLERRRELADRLMAHTTHDDTFFTRLSQKLSEAGVDLPAVTVEYRRLKVETEALVGAAAIATVGNIPLTYVKKLLGLHRGREARPLTILNSVQGRLVPGRLTLLLGPPACGKSSLMRALTGRMTPARGEVSGDIRYNGRTLDEFNVRRTAAYVDQVENHNPNLTVRETLDFAHKCQVGLHGGRMDVPAELAAQRIASHVSHVAGGGAGGGGESKYGSPAGGSKYGNSAYGQAQAHAHDPHAGGGSMYSVGSAGGSPEEGGGNGHNGYNGHNGHNGHNGKSGSATARFLRSIRSGRNDGSILSQAAPEDEFEKLLRQAWGTRVKVDIVMQLLGLSHCAETLVGDQLVRGISGGERKRLTAAEMLVGPCPVIMLDEMSTGLDSATLFTVVRWLSQATRSLRLTLMASLLQPPPEVFGLFDDVLLMAEGRILYHGPVSDVVPFFRDCVGLDCPDRKDVPSFLLEVTTPNGQRQFAGPELRTRFNLPPPDLDPELQGPGAGRSTSAPLSDAALGLGSNGGGPRPSEAGGQGPGQEGSAHGGVEASRVKFRAKSLLVSLEEMSEIFWTKNSHGVAMGAALAKSEAEAATAPAPPGPPPPPLVPSSDPFALRPLESIAAATQRQVTLFRRDRVLVKGRMIQVIVLGLITGSLFYNQGVSMAASRTMFGAAFMSVLFMSFGGFPQIPVTVELKKVWYKHRDAAFYPAYAQGLAMALTQLPMSTLEAVIFSVIMYFMTGFYMQPGYFFTFTLVMISVSMAISAHFRFLACLCPSMVIAQAASGISLVFLILTSGFAILHYSIPPWVIWCYWISPYSYALRALVVNEFVSPKWQDVPAPPGMPPGMSLGDAALESFDFYTTREWIWIGVGFCFGYFLVFTFAAIFCLEYLNPEVPVAQLADPAELAAARARAEARRHKFQALPAASGRLGPVVKAPKKKKSGNGSANGGESSKSNGGKDSDASRETGEGGGALVVSPSFAALQDYIDISSSLPFTPITLVFQDLKYIVPNPVFQRAKAKAYAKAQAVAQQGQIDSHAAKAASSPAVLDVEQGAVGAPGAPEGAAPSPPPIEARETLQLLSGITGFNEPGVLLALMGGSGAGKTTLMDVIAGRKTIGTISGTITVNGHTADPRAWSRVMGYVEQFDIHSPAQTVIEALRFSARLRLPPSFNDQQVKAYVEEVLEIVDMLPHMNSLVGSPGISGLSTEARKRLTIAVELVANPSCVFLDEPTSGLDARAAAIVMRAVRNVARNGRTVMVTIHQPSIEIFESFDQLLLIQRGGFTTYFGPLGANSAALIAYFMAVPGTPQLPAGFNPATWMLEVTGGSMATVLDRVDVDWPGLYAGSELCRENVARAAALIDARGHDCPPLAVVTQYAMPFGTQTRVLLDKFNKAYWRSPGYNFMRIGITFVVSFIYAAVYWGEGRIPNPADIGSVQNVMGIMFASSNFLGMTNLMSVMPVVGYERVVFYRERGAAMYDPFAYGLAIALVELPYLLVQAFIFVPIIYWMIMFEPTPEAFFYYVIVFFETISFYTIFGQTLVYITPAAAIAQVVGAGFNFLFNVFNGFIITYPDMPNGWRWMNRAVPPTWILYGLGVSQLGNNQEIIVYGGESSTVSEFMRTKFGYYYYMRWWIVLILAAYIIVMRVGSVVALKYWNFLRR